MSADPIGETDLDVLLASMEPALQAGTYFFCTVPREATSDELATAVATFREAEGTTLVLAEADAIAMHQVLRSPMAWITLTVHSSLDAVGLTGAVAGCLGDEAISCNVIAAFHHDHLFVPVARAHDAIRALTRLSAASLPDGKE